MMTSLSTVPLLQQIRFHSFEFKAQGFDIVFYVVGRAVAVLSKECERPAAKKWGQRLDDVIPADDRFVKCRGELVNRLNPQFVGITKADFFGAGDFLEFCQRRGGKN